MKLFKSRNEDPFFSTAGFGHHSLFSAIFSAYYEVNSSMKLFRSLKEDPPSTAALAISANFFALSRLSSASSPTNTSLTALTTFSLLMKSPVVLTFFFAPTLTPVLSTCVTNFSMSGSLLTKLAEMMRKALPEIKSSVMELEPRPRVFVVDLLGTEALEVAKELGIMRKHVLVTTSAWFLAFTVYMASLDKQELYKQLSSIGALLIPGCSPVKFERAQDPRKYIRELAESQRIGDEVITADGVFVNTWHSLEQVTIGSFLDPENLGRVMRGVPVYPVGPLVRPAEPGLKHGVLDWLDLQPKESVVYVSFGSGGALTFEQTNELAYGLELTGHRFVWVVRPPAEDDPSASMFDKTKNETEPLDFLPNGFLDRTKDIGLVVRTWAPQEEILAHKSTGGFVTHCGWNSVLESIVNGVPMVAWPLYSEQKMNARMVSGELKIALQINVADGIVKKEVIAEMVKRVMDEEEGKEMRKNVKELKKTAEEALNMTHIPSAYFT